MNRTSPGRTGSPAALWTRATTPVTGATTARSVTPGRSTIIPGSVTSFQNGPAVSGADVRRRFFCACSERITRSPATTGPWSSWSSSAFSAAAGNRTGSQCARVAAAPAASPPNMAAVATARTVPRSQPRRGAVGSVMDGLLRGAAAPGGPRVWGCSADVRRR